MIKSAGEKLHAQGQPAQEEGAGMNIQMMKGQIVQKVWAPGENPVTQTMVIQMMTEEVGNLIRQRTDGNPWQRVAMIQIARGHLREEQEVDHEGGMKMIFLIMMIKGGRKM